MLLSGGCQALRVYIGILHTGKHNKRMGIYLSYIATSTNFVIHSHENIFQ